uniref:Uncharacterized protein n=1 Tax=Lotus japonicus TaxID=34305 RepID=I3SEZ6_LOTJA|nr:unknown [Lotus japonicus]
MQVSRSRKIYRSKLNRSKLPHTFNSILISSQ